MSEKLLYYVDGYHGGIRGHMPLGCWRDILEMLKICPEWKLCIDVEPISWDYVKERDPAAYEEMKEMFRDQSVSSRLEMVSGSYAQPYGWITDGESNIRQLAKGIDLLKEHFPWMEIKTYAVQEPCWTSSMPQILRSLGFERAVLKNPSTAWGGYSEGFDAELCIWEGPDGTTIPLAPRYACEKLLHVWETESVNGEKEFALRCMENGISHPAGMIFQDLGWSAGPRLSGKPGYEEQSAPDHVQYVTWKEYFEQIADKPKQVWKIDQEVFQGTLPWGERLLVRMARQVRRGEIGLLNTERLHALAGIKKNHRNELPRLQEAWGHLLMTQHHDGWICAAQWDGEENWAWKTSAQIYAAESLIEPISRQAMADISHEVCPIRYSDENAETLCVVNPLGRAEIRTVKAKITSKRGVKSFRVYDGDCLLESQYLPERLYDDGSKNAGELLFRAAFDGFEAKIFRIEPCENADGEGAAKAWVEGSLAYLENSFYRIQVDLNQGGTIASLFDKRYGKEIVDTDASLKFNEYRGYFIKEESWCSSAQHRAEAQVVADGPVSAGLKIKGRVGTAEFTQEISVTEGDEKILVRVTFHFPKETYIGEPREIIPENKLEEGYRSYHDGRYKLNAYFPTVFEQNYIDKDAAYHVCRSRHADTHFKHWNEIKHNILVGWADASDGEQGLAVMADHTTSYIHGSGYPLGLTMAWGYDAGFWWGRRQLKGDHSLTYAILPHQKSWREADLWHHYQKMMHLPISQRLAGCAETGRNYGLVSVDGQVEMSAAYLDEKGRVLIRLFNPGETWNARIELDADAADHVELVELDGTRICCPEINRTEEKAVLQLQIPEYGIRTLRLTPARN